MIRATLFRIAPAILALGLASTGALAQPGTATVPNLNEPLPDGVAAIVNGEKIPMQEVYDALFRQYGKSMVDQIVRAKLAKQEAARVGVSVDPDEVKKRIDDWKKNFLQRFQNDVKAANEMLKKQGTSWDKTLAYMQNYHETENLWAQLVRNRKKPDLASLRGTFEAQYGKSGTKYEVAHIVLSTAINDARFADRYTKRDHYTNFDAVDKAAREKIAGLVARVKGGEDIHALAEEYSDDWSKQNGGRLGAFYQNRFGKTFDDAVDAAKLGDVLGPVKGREGWLCVKVVPAEFETEYTASHIFLAFGDPKKRDEVIERARELKAQIDKGADFAALAKAQSEDPLTKADGGKWGSFKGSEKVTQIGAAMRALKPGQTTDPVLTQWGVHLVKLGSKRDIPKGTKKAAAVIHVSTQYAQVRERTLGPAIKKEVAEKAARLIKELTAGGDFKKAVKEHSDEKFTRDRGGVISGYTSQRIDPKFHAVVETLEPGQVASEPVLTGYGYHIIKLIGRDKTDFASVKDELFKKSLEQAPSPMEIQQLQQQLMDMAAIRRRA